MMRSCFSRHRSSWYAFRAVQFNPDGGQIEFDFARPPARTPPWGVCVGELAKPRKPPTRKILPLCSVIRPASRSNPCGSSPASSVRGVSRSIPPQWRPIRLRLAPRADDASHPMGRTRGEPNGTKKHIHLAKYYRFVPCAGTGANEQMYNLTMRRYVPREPFNSTPMGLSSIVFGTPHVRCTPVERTCGVSSISFGTPHVCPMGRTWCLAVHQNQQERPPGIYTTARVRD